MTGKRTLIKKTTPIIIFLALFAFYLHRAAPPAAVAFDADRRLAASCLGIPSSPGDPLSLLVLRCLEMVTPLAAVGLGLANLLLLPLTLLLFLVLMRRLAGRFGLSDSLAPALIVVLLGALEPRLGVLALAQGGGALASFLLVLAALALTAEGLRRRRLTAFYLWALSLVASPYGWAFFLLFLPGAVRWKGLKRFVLGLCVLVLGVSPFLYLPLRAAVGPVLETAHPVRFWALLGYLLPSDYLSLSNVKLAARGLVYFAFPAGLFGLLGILMLRRWRHVFAALGFLAAVILANYPCFDTVIGGKMMEEGAGFLLSFCFSLGCGLLLARAAASAKSRSKKVFWLTAALLIFVGGERARHFPDLSGLSYGYDHARGILELTPDEATVYLEDSFFSPPVFSLHARGWGRERDLCHVQPEIYGGAAEMRRLVEEGKPEDYRRRFHLDRLASSPWVFYDTASSYLGVLGLAGESWGLLKLVRGERQGLPQQPVPRFLEDESRWANWPSRCLVAAYAQSLALAAASTETRAYYLAMTRRAAGEAPFVLYWLGRYHMAGGELEKAIRYFVRVTKAEPRSVQAYTALALCYDSLAGGKTQDVDWADVYFFKALGVNPRYRELLVARGEYFLRRRQAKKALVFFETAWKLWGASPELVKLTGYGYSELEGQEEKALAYLRQYLAAEAEAKDAARVRELVAELEKRK